MTTVSILTIPSTNTAQPTRRQKKKGCRKTDDLNHSRFTPTPLFSFRQRLLFIIFRFPPTFFLNWFSIAYTEELNEISICVWVFFFVYTDMIFHVVVRSCLSRAQPTANSRSTSARKTSLAVKKNMRQRRIVKNKRHSIVFFFFSCCFFSTHFIYVHPSALLVVFNVPQRHSLFHFDILLFNFYFIFSSKK